MGITHLEQIEELGFEEMCRRYVQYYPERLNANAFLGIVTALDGVTWVKASARHRALAHAMVRQLRAEFGLKPATRSSSSRSRRRGK